MNGVRHAVQAYDDCASGYRSWRWSALWDKIEVPTVIQHLPAAGNVIDLGCGYGRYAAACIGKGLSYCGVDASSGMLDLVTERRAAFVHADLRWYQSAVLADVVLCTRVLSNLRDPRAVLRAVSRNLQAGGSFMLTDFHEGYRFERQTIEGRNGCDVAVPVFRHPAEAIRRAIRRTGLKLDEEKVLHSEGRQPVLMMYRGTKPS